MRKSPIILLLLLVITSFISGCRTVPYTGRRQFIMTSKAEEAQMGKQAWNEILSKSKISNNKAYNKAVSQVGKNIAKVVKEPGFDWEFKVIESPQANAFCLPGGKVAVYSGLFKYVDNDAELATVVAHEVGHAVARHGGERVSHAQVQAIGAQAVGASVGEEWMAAYGVVSQLGVNLPYSREQEYEADHLGLVYMSQAGYHPGAATSFWKKFSTTSKDSAIAEFFSTHPMSSKRLEEMNKLMPMAVGYYNKAPVKRNKGDIYRKSK